MKTLMMGATTAAMTMRKRRKAWTGMRWRRRLLAVSTISHYHELKPLSIGELYTLLLRKQPCPLIAKICLPISLSLFLSLSFFLSFFLSLSLSFSPLCPSISRWQRIRCASARMKRMKQRSGKKHALRWARLPHLKRRAASVPLPSPQLNPYIRKRNNVIFFFRKERKENTSIVYLGKVCSAMHRRHARRHMSVNFHRPDCTCPTCLLCVGGFFFIVNS